MATLPSIVPDQTSSKLVKTRILESGFGDGYNQRAVDGINSVMDEWDLSWTGLSYTNANTLVDFFEARGGYESFDWVPLRESSSKKFICSEWSERYPGPSNVTITARFIQVFDLA